MAADVQQFLVPQRGGESEETVYVPMAQAPRQAVTLVVRTRADPRAHAELIRTEIRKINPDVTINTVETMEEFASKYTVALDVLTAILGGFSVFALLLASLGTYGVAATLILFVVTLAASVVPATRAANVDPVLVLKAE